MVTLDADGGAFSPGLSFAYYHAIPAEFINSLFTSATLSEKMAASAPAAALNSDPLWVGVNTLVANEYKTSSNSDVRCDKSGYECRTVSMFNQYAKGVDWWGTASISRKNALTALTSLVSWDAASLLDGIAKNEAVNFINDYFKYTTSEGKRKRFPAVFSVYLPGIDHYAHGNGMGGYVKYFEQTTDPAIKEIIDTLKNQDEFNNKIFIITADHRHTAMPTDLTYRDKNWLGNDVDKPAEMSCKLKTDFLDPQNPDHITSAQKAELANNNLHIWELAELFKITGQIKGAAGLNFAVMAPHEIAGLYSQFPFGAKPDTATANVIAALNGPMAHIYVKNQTTNSWNAPRLIEDVGYIAELLRLSLSKDKSPSNSNSLFTPGLFEKAIPISAGLKNLLTSIDVILVRRGNNYEVFRGIQPDSSDVISTPLNNYPDFGLSKYVKALARINGMNHPDRSGDIVLLMKDEMDISTLPITAQRFTTGVACKSWHGSLNQSDSYVPLIISYPGGNASELGPLIDNTQGCSTAQGCDGNWRVTDLIKTIIQKEYGSQ